jgi:epidermal growth factor receptor substrate 15
MSQIRVTQVAALVAAQPQTEMRITQVAIESLCSQPPGTDLYVSQVAVEVLCSVPVFEYSVSATTSITLSGSASESASVQIFASATTSLSLSASSFGYAPGDKFVLAVTGLGVAGSGGGEGRSPGNVFLSVNQPIALSGTAASRVAYSRSVSAVTSILFHSVAYSPSERAVSATTTILLSQTPAARSSSIYVSAASSIGVSGTGIEAAILFINVSATTSIAFSDSLAYLIRGGKSVAASTKFKLSSLSTQYKNITASVSGVTSVSLSSTSSESADLNASGSSSLAMIVSGVQCRDIYASASLSLGIGPASKTSNLKSVDALSTISLTVSASVTLSGTVAESGIKFVDLAQAVVWIPWRRAGLTLEPGGNLPHS